MATPVELPKLGNTVEECIVSRWAKHSGDAVAAGDLVAEIETDKAMFELEAPVEGTILATFFEEGALVPVFTNLFVIGKPGEDVEAFRPKAAAASPAAPALPATGGTAPARPASAGLASAVSAPAAQDRAPVGSASAPGALSPRARRFAEERDFHPAAVQGSGPGGRVLEQDLRDLYFSSPRVSETAKAQAHEGAEVPREGSGAAGMILAADLGPPAVRISNIRERIARRMRESLASTAQYTLNASADAGGLLRLRAKIKASGATPDINLNDLVTFCAIQALLEMPDVNAEFIDGKIHPHRRRAYRLRLRHAARAAGARGPRRAPDQRRRPGAAHEGTDRAGGAGHDLRRRSRGATFTVSNLGSLGIESFTPLLNPPQVAILGVDAIQLKPVRRNGKLEFIDAIGLSLTCDHQVIDGAPGARFLKVVKEKIENVERYVRSDRDRRRSGWIRGRRSRRPDGQEGRADREGTRRRDLPERRLHSGEDLPAVVEAVSRVSARRRLTECAWAPWNSTCRRWWSARTAWSAR